MEIRRLKFGANIIAFAFVFFLLWAMANYLNARHHHRFDLTETRQYSLSPKTVSILKELREPVRVTALYRPGTYLYRSIKDILEEYSDKTDKITVEHIDPESDRAKVELLARRLKMRSFDINTVIFECGEKAKHVSESDVIEYDNSPYSRGQSPPKIKAEEAFTSAILECTQEKQTNVYLVTGHGERDIDDRSESGISAAAEYLRKQNFRAEKLSILAKGKVPDDCDALVIVGPEKEFSTQEEGILREYLSSGGKLLLMVEPMRNSGLDGLLSEWGVELSEDILLDPTRQLFFTGPETIFAEEYGYHEITEKMKGIAAVFSLARSVKFSSQDNSLEGHELVKTSQDAWAEKDVTTLMKERKAKYDEEVDEKGPLSLAVAVTGARSPYGYQESPGLRLVVFGDSDFVSNGFIGNVGNSDIFLNSVNWLAEREKLISIGPKSPDIRTVTLSEKQMQLIFWSTIGALPFVVVIMGLIVWTKRRK